MDVGLWQIQTDDDIARAVEAAAVAPTIAALLFLTFIEPKAVELRHRAALGADR